MFNFLKKIFSAKKSNTENTQVDATPLYTVENFRKALIEDDIDFIIDYVEAGADVNAKVSIERHETVDIHYDHTWYETCLLLDIVRNSDIKEYLAKHGAITYEELKRRQQLAEEEKQRERDKENEEKNRLYEAEKKRKEEYVRRRIAEVEESKESAN